VDVLENVERNATAQCVIEHTLWFERNESPPACLGTSRHWHGEKTDIRTTIHNDRILFETVTDHKDF
jgi:hypothetical protein